MKLKVEIPIRPELDPEFLPAALWNRAFRERVGNAGRPAGISVLRGGRRAASMPVKLHKDDAALNWRYAERLAKFLLWRTGGDGVKIEGDDALDAKLQTAYAQGGERAFDHEFFKRVFSGPAPQASAGLGGHWQGCRIGFDLGASDRKCAAVVDGEVVFSEEVRWDPASAKDPAWHVAEIQDSIRRAAAKLPRVDAIGGSSAGILLGGEVRMSSLFRGVPEADFAAKVRGIFSEVRKPWPKAAFAVINDGSVTALLGASALERRPVLGLALGSSLAAGAVGADGWIVDGIDELAFAPIDYREDAPADEWSSDRGCAVQYLSQQAVVRLLPAAGITLPAAIPAAEKLACVQQLMSSENPAAERVYRTLGVYFGYAVAHYAEFYPVDNVLALGRVMTGSGGKVILDSAMRVLGEVFPDISCRIETLSESGKRHGQAVAAASLAPGGKA